MGGVPTADQVAQAQIEKELAETRYYQKQVAPKKPKQLIVENVPAILTMIGSVIAAIVAIKSIQQNTANQLLIGRRFEENRVVLDSIKDSVGALFSRNPRQAFRHLLRENERLRVQLARSLTLFFAASGARTVEAIEERVWAEAESLASYDRGALKSLFEGFYRRRDAPGELHLELGRCPGPGGFAVNRSRLPG